MQGRVNLTAKQQLGRNPQNAGYATPIKTYPVPAVTNEDGTISVPAQPVYGIDPNHEPIDMYMATRMIDGGLLRYLRNPATPIGASLQCPAGKRWKVLSYSCDLTCSATVGNRLVYARITPDGNAFDWLGSTSTAVTAAQVLGYDIGMGAPINTPSTTVRRNRANTANTNVQVRESSSLNIIGANGYIGLVDTAAIDAADSMNYSMVVVEYDV